MWSGPLCQCAKRHVYLRSSLELLNLLERSPPGRLVFGHCSTTFAPARVSNFHRSMRREVGEAPASTGMGGIGSVGYGVTEPPTTMLTSEERGRREVTPPPVSVRTLKEDAVVLRTYQSTLLFDSEISSGPTDFSHEPTA